MKNKFKLKKLNTDEYANFYVIEEVQLVKTSLLTRVLLFFGL